MRLKPYRPVFRRSKEGPGILDLSTGRVHKRPSYSDIELASVSRWLNERSAGYPTVPGTPFTPEGYEVAD